MKKLMLIAIAIGIMFSIVNADNAVLVKSADIDGKGTSYGQMFDVYKYFDGSAIWKNVTKNGKKLVEVESKLEYQYLFDCAGMDMYWTTDFDEYLVVQFEIKDNNISLYDIGLRSKEHNGESLGDKFSDKLNLDMTKMTQIFQNIYYNEPIKYLFVDGCSVKSLDIDAEGKKQRYRDTNKNNDNSKPKFEISLSSQYNKVWNFWYTEVTLTSLKDNLKIKDIKVNKGKCKIALEPKITTTNVINIKYPFTINEYDSVKGRVDENCKIFRLDVSDDTQTWSYDLTNQ